jgi:hypothetical protein
MGEASTTTPGALFVGVLLRVPLDVPLGVGELLLVGVVVPLRVLVGVGETLPVGDPVLVSVPVREPVAVEVGDGVPVAEGANPGQLSQLMRCAVRSTT